MIYRIHKISNYTVISNELVKDERLSLKAKGMMLMLLSLPDNWNFSVKGLSSICKEAINTINSILNELEKYNYLERVKIYENGKIKNWEYHIYEIPKNLYLNFQDIENLDIEKLDIENKAQLNNNIINKKELNNNIYYEDSELNELFLEYLQVRKKLKAINSDRAIKMLINKLEQYDNITKYKMIEQSIVNSWKDVYPLKSDTHQRKIIEAPHWLNKNFDEKNERILSEEDYEWVRNFKESNK